MRIARACLALLLTGVTSRLARPTDSPWQSLFDGKTFTGWTLGDGGPVTHSWIIEDGAFTTVPGAAGRSDLLCTRPVRDFELAFEFRLSAGSNTGIKYFVQHTLRYLNPGTPLAGAYGAIGLEFQLADDAGAEVPGADQKLGALYGLLPAQAAAGYTVGQWEAARLVCRQGACEHWLGNRRVLAFDVAALRETLQEAAVNPRHSIVGAAAALVAARRRTGTTPPAFLALQQHSSKAWFRNLRVRDLD